MTITFYVKRIGYMPHESNHSVPKLNFYVLDSKYIEHAYDYFLPYMVADLNTGELKIGRTTHWVESIPKLIELMQFVNDEINKLKAEIKASGYSLPYNEDTE